MIQPVFDTHAHLISSDQERYPPSPMHGALRAVDRADAFDADELIARMDEAGVSHACAVQRGHVYGYNNAYVLDSARRYPDRLTPVIMLNAATEDAAATLRRMAAEQHVGGVRLAAARIVDHDTTWLNSPPAMRMWEAAAQLRIPVCVIFFASHLEWNLPALKKIAEQFPDLSIVIDHVGVPHGSNYEVDWVRDHDLPTPDIGPPNYGVGRLLSALGVCSNVSFKLTGINFERLAGSGVEPSAFLRRLIDEFGADRLMWGSDIGQTAGPYGRLVEQAREATATLSEAEGAMILSGTAASIYRI